MPWMNLDYFEQLSDDKQQRVLRTHLLLGVNPVTGDGFWLPIEDMYPGTHVIGVQGTGKSSLLESMIHYDIQEGRAVIVLDPHGDLVDHCLAALPGSALNRTSVLDMADESYPFGANLFAQGSLNTEAARTQAVQRIKHVFDIFWPEVMKQQYAPQYLHYATRVMLDNSGTSLYDLRRFLLEREYRAQLLKNVREPSVRDYWQREYNPLKQDTQISRSRPLLNRWHLLTASPLLRNIICQPSGIDFRAATERHEALFFKLPTTTMETDAGMVGTVIMGQIMAAVFAYRLPVSLYVDEFYAFMTPDFEKLYSQGRKFGLRMVVAHQRRSQLTGEMQDATQSARNTIVFRVTPDDSRKYAQIFPVTAARPKPEDIHLYPCDYLMSHTHLMTDRGVAAFVAYYLLPLKATHSSHGQVVITDPEYRAEEFISSGQGLLTGAEELVHVLIGTPNKKALVRVPDPTPILDALLREVMASNNPRLPIPPVVVRGLANCGDFFSAVRNITENHPALQPDFTPPPHLVRVDGNSWTLLRDPESPGEWLAHCAFLLRRTMAYLADHPLGNVKETGTSEIAQKLARLPKRIAFVKSGDDFGPIQTLDAPQPSEGSELRSNFVIRQSHERYCHPREDVEAAFTSEETSALAEPEPDEPIATETAPQPELSPELSSELPEEPAVSRWEL